LKLLLKLLKLKEFDMLKESVTLFVVFAALAVGWYVFWVQPREDFLNAVMDCMEDGTEEAYNECVDIVRVKGV